MTSYSLLQRRHFLRLAAGGFGSGGALFGYGALVERRHPVIERVVCPLPPGREALHGLTIAAMSDFHHDDFNDDTLMGRAIEMTNALRPDLVMLPGDFISRDIAGLDTLLPHLSGLQARLGVFAMLGNHDQWVSTELVSHRLSAAGVGVLANAATELRAPATGERFFVAGLESAWDGDPDLSRTLRGVPGNAPVLLGWHEPDPFDSIEDHRVLLQIAGHTHGGQVCAPFFGALQLPRHGRKYVAGLFQRGDARLYVTRGIGAMGVPVRFCCPPEITLIELRVAA